MQGFKILVKGELFYIEVRTLNKNIIFIGASGAGKTTLIRALQGSGKVHKTQTLTFEGGFIDIPGEYMDIPRLNHAVIVTAMDAGAIVVVQDSTSNKPTTPPGFCKMFNIPVYGVISKIDAPSANIKRAGEYLKMCGALGEHYLVSAVTGEGVETLKVLIKNIKNFT